MRSELIILVFCLWVLFQARKGFRNGIWMSLLLLTGFALAYVVTFLAGGQVSDFVAGLGFDSEYRLLVVYPAVFFGVSALVQFIPPLLFPSLKNRTRASAFWGAGFGVLTGVFTGLIGVWFFSLAEVALQSKGHENGARVVQAITLPEERAALEEMASTLVAESTEFGLKLSGMDAADAELSASVARQPAQVMRNLQDTLASPEMRGVISNPQIQRMMALNDVGSLRASPAFQELANLDAAQNLLAVLAENGKNQDEAEQFLAEQLTFIWRRLQYLKNDAEVQAFLRDEQLQSLVRENNFAAMMMNAKFQQLVGVVLDRNHDMSEIDFAAMIDSPEESDQTRIKHRSFVPEQNNRPAAIYKWIDENGSVQYSDENQLPAKYAETAEKVFP